MSSTWHVFALAPGLVHSQSDSASQPVVRFEVSEGTWMSVDVSPDGATIVFDLLGDLYTIPISGGMATPLTTGIALDHQARFSPDGRQVAFVSDRSGTPNIWITDRSGYAARQLSHLPSVVVDGDNHVSSPTWSPDGKTIVVSQPIGAVRQMKMSLSQDQVEHPSRWLLAAYDVVSGRMRWISDTAASRARQAMGPVFSADGENIYAAVAPYRSAPSLLTLWHIERVGLKTGSITPEMSPWLARAGMRPAVSRDGRYLAYVSASGSRLGLRLRDLSTYKERWVVQEKLDIGSFWGAESRDLSPGYAFTPDSKALVLAFDGKIHRIELSSGRQHIIPFVADIERELAPTVSHQFSWPDTAVRTRSVMQPALSPDGKAVAFSALSRIWVMNLPINGEGPSKPRRLTSDNHGEFYPVWSPDGSWIAYSSWRDGEGGAVRRAKVGARSRNATVATERMTADTALYFNTAIAPDASYVVAVRATLPPHRVLTHSSTEAPDSLTVVRIPAAGGSPAPVISLENYMSQAAGAKWGASRTPVEQIYFTAEPGRLHIGLTSISLDGSDYGTDLSLTNSVTDVSALNDVTGVVSPDGRRALVTQNWALSEVTLPLLQGTQVDTLDLRQAQGRPFGDPSGAAARWGRALAPWISWSRDGRRVLFVQGGTLFVGAVPDDGWARFRRVDVPLTVSEEIPRGTLHIRGARLITMRGHEIIAQGDLIVRNNRIVAVGPTGKIRAPAGARVLNASGKVILPGYIDIHDHLQYPYGVHPEQCWACLIRLAHGITSLRDPYAPQTLYSDIFAYRERERTGQLLSPRVFSTGIVHYRSDRPASTLGEARAVVRPTAEFFGAETLKEYSVAPWTERRLIAAAAAEAGLNATIHGDPLRAVIDGYPGVEHAMPIPLYDDVLTLIARSGTTYTHTYGTIIGADGYVLSTGREPWEHERMRRFVPPLAKLSASRLWLEEVRTFGHPEFGYLRPLLASAAAIVARGGRVGMGSHGNIPGIGIHYEMWFHALGGMAYHDILRAATIVGAAAIGHANDFGSLGAGKLADLQILDKNPLDDIKNTTSIRFVMKNGRLYQAKDLTEIWPRHKPLDPIYLFPDSAGTAADAR